MTTFDSASSSTTVTMAVQFLQSNMADNDDVLFTEGFDCVIYVFIIGFVWLISSRQQTMCRAELFS